MKKKQIKKRLKSIKEIALKRKYKGRFKFSSFESSYIYMDSNEIERIQYYYEISIKNKKGFRKSLTIYDGNGNSWSKGGISLNFPTKMENVFKCLYQWYEIYIGISRETYKHYPYETFHYWEWVGQALYNLQGLLDMELLVELDSFVISNPKEVLKRLQVF